MSIVSNYIININLIEYVIKERRIPLPFVDFRFSIIRTLCTQSVSDILSIILQVVEIFCHLNISGGDDQFSKGFSTNNLKIIF